MMPTLSDKDRLALRRGGIAMALMLSWMLGLRPAISSFRDLSDQVEAQRATLVRELAVLSSINSYADAVELSGDQLLEVSSRLFGGETDGVAAAYLAEYVQSAARSGRALLNRLDPTEAQVAYEGLNALSVSVHGESDVEGLVTLLYLLEGGEKLVHITDLRIQASRGASDMEVITFQFLVTGFQLDSFADADGRARPAALQVDS